MTSKDDDALGLEDAWTAFEADGELFWEEMNALVEMLADVPSEEARDA